MAPANSFAMLQQLAEQRRDEWTRRLGAALARARAADERLQRWFAAELPAHLRPSEVRWVDALPLSPNGKIDRAALSTELSA